LDDKLSQSPAAVSVPRRRRWLERLARGARACLALRLGKPQWESTRLDGLAEYAAHQFRNAGRLAQQRAVERRLMTLGEEFKVPGRCWVCDREVEFAVDYRYSYPIDGVVTPNWRERLVCSGCNLDNRMRATAHFLEARLRPGVSAAIYLTEQVTPLFHRLAARHHHTIGSEYLGGAVAFGQCTPDGIRNESITRLTFPAASFDFVVCLDVLEHVPEYQRGLAECLRVLVPGGALLLSVPFLPQQQENLVRAVIDANGETRHLLPPEYHGDPLQRAGCLAYYVFGWELLDQARRLGFRDVCAHVFWSRDYGYLGQSLLFVARKAGPAPVAADPFRGSRPHGSMR
jgi:SAM-dependent methyltransferase